MTDLDKLLARLRRAGQQPKRSLLNQVKALGPAVVPPLIAMATDERLHHADGNSPDVWAPLHAIQVLGELRAAEAVEPLLPLMAWDDDWLAEALPNCFGQIGQPAFEPLRCLLFDHGQNSWVVGRTARALRQVAEHHPELRERVVQALVARLDPSQTRNPEDESANALVICELCDLEAVEAAPAIDQAYAEDRVDRRIIGVHSVETSLGLELTTHEGEREPKGVLLWLRCKLCGYERPHDVEKVYIGLEATQDDESSEEKYVIPQTITCPRCGAVDQYELTAKAYLAFTAEMLKPIIGADVAEGVQERRARPVVLAPFGLQDGRPREPAEARELYAAQVAAEPSRVDLRTRYAGVLLTMGEREAAEAEFRRALVLAPDDVEAHLELGKLAQEDGDRSEARQQLRRVLELAPRSDLTAAVRQRYEETARDALAELDLPPRPPVPAPAASTALIPGLAGPLAEPYTVQQPIRVGPKIGRNEPCPCGSGRKYKKCCGR